MKSCLVHCGKKPNAVSNSLSVFLYIHTPNVGTQTSVAYRIQTSNVSKESVCGYTFSGTQDTRIVSIHSQFPRSGDLKAEDLVEYMLESVRDVTGKISRCAFVTSQGGGGVSLLAYCFKLLLLGSKSEDTANGIKTTRFVIKNV